MVGGGGNEIDSRRPRKEGGNSKRENKGRPVSRFKRVVLHHFHTIITDDVTYIASPDQVLISCISTFETTSSVAYSHHRSQPVRVRASTFTLRDTFRFYTTLRSLPLFNACTPRSDHCIATNHHWTYRRSVEDLDISVSYLTRPTRGIS